MTEKLNADLTRDLSLRQLQAVAAIARLGKITSAANHLSVTPPAVTLQLQSIERIVGLSLFDRTPKGLRPTDAGRYFASLYARVESLLEEANETVLEMKSIGRGRVRIGAVSAAQYFTPRIVAAFSKSHPRIEIELYIANRLDTVAHLAQFKLDMAIMGRPPEPPELEQPTDHQIIGAHPHVIIANPTHRLVHKRRIMIETLEGEQFIVREPGSGTRSLMERTFTMARISPRTAMTFSSTETIKQSVMAGLGIAFVSAHTVSSELKDGRLAVLRVQGFPVMRHWYAVRPKERQLPPAGQAMWNFLIEEGTRHMPEWE